jgi:hypothetical protein
LTGEFHGQPVALASLNFGLFDRINHELLIWCWREIMVLAISWILRD